MKMNKKTWFLIVGALLLLQASSCRPEPEPQKYMGTYPLGDIKDYLYFKPGSMWVYECDSTGELDTQVMVSCDTPWLNYSYLKIQKIQFIQRSITQKIIYTNKQPFNEIPYNKNYRYFLQLERIMSNNGSLDAVFFKPFDSAVIGAGSSPTYYKGLLTNYTVLGNTYDSVRVFQVQISAGWPVTSNKFYETVNKYAKVDYFYAKGVGIVKLRIWSWNFVRNKPNTHNWNLKSFKVTQ